MNETASTIRKPEEALFTYYAIASLFLGPLFFVILIPRYFRYHTLRYEIDDEGVSMRWGILFRREVSLTYSRIQDIHLSSNFIERWLGLARIQIQTASGSAGAEMTIEGLKDFESLRNFLYSRMRGVRRDRARAVAQEETRETAPLESTDALAAILADAVDELRAIRRALESRPPDGNADA